MSYVLAGLALGLLIIFHEFGHFWVARRTGMRVERFSVGFGPVVTSFRRGETEFVLSAVPLGGYVKIAGMAPEDEIDAGDRRNYANRPAWQRLLVIGAGPAANYVLSICIGIVLLSTVHMVPNADWTRVSDATAGYPAAAAGMQPNDEITSVDGTAVHDWAGLKEAIRAAAHRHPDAAFPVTVRRGSSNVTLSVKPNQMGKDEYVIGVTPADKEEPGQPILSAIGYSVRNVGAVTVEQARLIGKLITRQMSTANLSGPIGIISATATEAKKGFRELVGTVWYLSIAVGFVNMMPIPGLDGGRFLFLMYEVIARRRMDQRVEGWIHGIGLLLLLVLIVVVSYGDIMHLVHHG